MNGKYLLPIKFLKKSIKIIMVTAIFLAGCSKEKESVPTTQMQTMTIAAKTISNPLYFSGIINPIKEESVASPLEGVIKKQLFRYGQEIKKGQPLFSIALDRLEKEYIDAVSTYFKAKDDYATKKRKLAGSEELRNLQFIAENEYFADKTSTDESYFALQQAIRHLKETMAKLGIKKDLDEIDIKDAEFVKKTLHNKFEDYIVTAPSHGIALAPQKSSEETTSENKIAVGGEIKQGQILLALGDMSGLSTVIEVNEIDINQIKPNQKAIITGTAFTGITLEGEVKYIDAQAKSNSSGALPVFAVTIQIPKISQQARDIIHVGMSARVEIAIEENNVIVVPLSAVFQESGKSKVKIKNKKGDIETIPVITGHTTEDSIVIKQGLKVGDTLVYHN